MAKHSWPMFERKPTARADMTAGALYAVNGEGGWIYYGQVTPEKTVGFFRRRDRQPATPTTADYGAEEAEWHVGGPIWRERRIKEEMAERFDQHWNRLPTDWVPTTRR